MERVYIQDVEHPKGSGRIYAKKGDICDHPIVTFKGIAESLFPNVKNSWERFKKICIPIEELGSQLGMEK